MIVLFSACKDQGCIESIIHLYKLCNLLSKNGDIQKRNTYKNISIQNIC